jgi:hypothetical protein
VYIPAIVWSLYILNAINPTRFDISIILSLVIKSTIVLCIPSYNILIKKNLPSYNLSELFFKSVNSFILHSAIASLKIKKISFIDNLSSSRAIALFACINELNKIVNQS